MDLAKYGMVYKTKPFKGDVMNKNEFKGKMVVAISEKKMKRAYSSGKPLFVVDKTEKVLTYMEFKGNEIPKDINVFADKYRNNELYRLFYYVWNPIVQTTLF